MVKMFLVTAFIWTLVMLTIQSFKQASGQKLISWVRLAGVGLIGALVTGALLFIIVNVF